MSQVVFHPQKLADFISLKRGHDLPESQRLPGEIPVVSSAGITGFHNEAKCEGPGVVTGRYGTLGELHYVEGSYWPLNTTLYVEDFKGNDPRFVYYFLQTLDLAQFNGAGAVPGLNRNALAMIDVVVPDPEVQKVIAEQLNSFDLLADNLMRQIKILEDAARQIYTEWFVRLRFPGCKPNEHVDELPNGWRRDRVDSLLTLQRGFDLPADQRIDDDIPIIASTGICGTHSISKVSGPGVVTGRSGTLGKVHLVLEDFWPLNTTLWVKEYRGISPYFAYFLL